MEGDSQEAPVFMLSAGTDNHVVAIADIFYHMRYSTCCYLPYEC